MAILQQHPEPQLAIEYPVQAKRQKIAYETEDPLQNAPAIQDENSTVTDETYDSSDQDLMELIGNSADSTEMMTQYNQQVVTSEGTVTKQVLQKKTSPRPPPYSILAPSVETLRLISTRTEPNPFLTFLLLHTKNIQINLFLYLKYYYVHICLTSVMHAKLNDKMAFPA